MGGRKPLELFGTNIALAVVSCVQADCRNLITFLSTNIFETHWLSLTGLGGNREFERKL